MTCPYCGVHELTTADVDGKCLSCRNLPPKNIIQGWECPRCHSIYSPFTSACPKCDSGNGSPPVHVQKEYPCNRCSSKPKVGEPRGCSCSLLFDWLINYQYKPDPYPTGTFSGDHPIPSPCSGCSNNPPNGGSGICHCILGMQEVSYLGDGLNRDRVWC